MRPRAKNFSAAAPGAMSGSCGPAAHPCRSSAGARVGGLYGVFFNASRAGDDDGGFHVVTSGSKHYFGDHLKPRIWKQAASPVTIRRRRQEPRKYGFQGEREEAFPFSLGDAMTEVEPLAVDDWPAGEERRLPLAYFGEAYRRYRLPDEAAEVAMARSLSRDGQLSPSIVCLREARVEMVDGFKRLSAARRLGNWSCLWARRLDLDESAAKAAIYRLNQVGRPTRELEEAWIVRALVREDGVPQAVLHIRLSHT
jgi:hypothetical protein